MYNSPENIIARYNEFIQNNVSPENALYLIQLMFELTHKGFEWYMSTYFHKVKKFKTKVIGGFEDKGIDVEGYKILGHKEIFLAIQCKKWSSWHIKKKDILEFDYNAKQRENYSKEHELYFITTTNASKGAREVANIDRIKLIDCRTLIKMKKYYGIDDFRKDSSIRRNPEWLFHKYDTTKIIENYLNGQHRVFYPTMN